MPSPSACQALPFQRAMKLHGTASAVVKSPPAINSPL